MTDETYSRLEGKSLTVTLFDGTKLFHVTGDKAVRISQDKYERLAKELRLRERDLTNTTADTSVEEEKKLQQELDILRGSNSSQTAQHRSKIAPSVSLQGSSVINGTETDCGLDDKPTISELSEQELTRLQSRTEATQSQVERPTGLKPGKVISLGLSYVDGYKAGYRDGRSTAEELHKVIQEKRTRPQWKWWGRSPKPISSVHPHRSFGTSQDLSDIDAVIRSRHHRCVHAKVDAHVARSQSLTAVHQYKRPNKTTAKDVIYQRPHTADPSESKRIEYRSERQRQIQEGVNKTRLNHQMQQAACDEFKRYCNVCIIVQILTDLCYPVYSELFTCMPACFSCLVSLVNSWLINLFYFHVVVLFTFFLCADLDIHSKETKKQNGYLSKSKQNT